MAYKILVTKEYKNAVVPNQVPETAALYSATSRQVAWKQGTYVISVSVSNLTINTTSYQSLSAMASAIASSHTAYMFPNYSQAFMYGFAENIQTQGNLPFRGRRLVESKITEELTTFEELKSTDIVVAVKEVELEVILTWFSPPVFVAVSLKTNKDHASAVTFEELIQTNLFANAKIRVYTNFTEAFAYAAQKQNELNA